MTSEHRPKFNEQTISGTPEIHRKTGGPEIKYDEFTDIITIDGYRFAREVFGMIANDAIGTKLKIVKRENGCVTFERIAA